MTAEGGHCCVASEGYVLWNAAHAAVHGSDPYADEITQENDIYYYDSLVNARGFEPQRFAYPLFALLPVLPVGWLSFRTASWVLLIVFAVLASLWIGWLRAEWNSRTLFYTALVFASYPVFYDFLSLQPTLLFLTFAIAGLALFRSGHAIAAALMMTLSMGKPQIAAPILLPVVIAAVVEGKEYRRLVAWVVVIGAGLVLAGAMVRRGWIAEWVSAAREYASYSPHSMASGWFGHAAPLISGLILLVILAVLWACRHSELLFRVSLSVVLLYPLLPYRTYNAAVFTIPIVWLADNAARVKASGSSNEVALAIVRVSVIVLWVLTAAGAALLWTPTWKIGFMLPVMGVQLVFFSLFAAMLLQCIYELRVRIGTAVGAAAS